MSWHQHRPQHSKWRAPASNPYPVYLARLSPSSEGAQHWRSQGWPVLPHCSSITGAKKHLSLGFKERLEEYWWISPNFILLQVHYMVKESSFFLFNLYTSQQVKWDCRFLPSCGMTTFFSLSPSSTPTNLQSRSPTHQNDPPKVWKESKGTPCPCSWAVCASLLAMQVALAH